MLLGSYNNQYNLYNYSSSNTSGVGQNSGQSNISGVSGSSGASIAEIIAKINNITNKVANGDISIEDAVKQLKSLGISVPEPITTGDKKQVSFTFNGKSYTLNEIKSNNTDSTNEVNNTDNNDKEVQDFINQQLRGKKFESMDEFKNFCGEYTNKLNMQQVYSDNSYNHYKISCGDANTSISIKKPNTNNELDSLIDKLSGKTFDSLNELKEFCGENLSKLNIQQVYSDNNNR